MLKYKKNQRAHVTDGYSLKTLQRQNMCTTFILFLLVLGLSEAQVSDCFRGLQYEFFNQARTFTDAQGSCQDDASNLVTILNNETNLFIIDFLNSVQAADTWIGLIRRPPSDSLDPLSFHFVNDDQANIFGPIKGELPWGNDDPDIDDDTDETCAVISGGEDVWFDRRCSNSNVFLCEQECTQPTPNPTTNPSSKPTKNPSFNPTILNTERPSKSPNISDELFDDENSGQNLFGIVFLGVAAIAAICLGGVIFVTFRERNELKRLKAASLLKEDQLKILIT